MTFILVCYVVVLVAINFLMSKEPNFYFKSAVEKARANEINQIHMCPPNPRDIKEAYELILYVLNYRITHLSCILFLIFLLTSLGETVPFPVYVFSLMFFFVSFALYIWRVASLKFALILLEKHDSLWIKDSHFLYRMAQVINLPRCR